MFFVMTFVRKQSFLNSGGRIAPICVRLRKINNSKRCFVADEHVVAGRNSWVALMFVTMNIQVKLPAAVIIVVVIVIVIIVVSSAASSVSITATTGINISNRSTIIGKVDVLKLLVVVAVAVTVTVVLATITCVVKFV